MMDDRRCAACGKSFRPSPRVRNQKYCGKGECRRARRRHWQRAKRQEDADYRDNQARAQRAWSGENGTYWRAYRSRHPEYAEENRRRTKQRKRDRRQHAAEGNRFAKMDSIGVFSSVPSGTYLLVPQGVEEFAKMDSIMVEITLLSKS
jgi:hypothetical protein